MSARRHPRRVLFVATAAVTLVAGIGATSATASPSPPRVPTALRVVHVDAASVQLSWHDSAHGTASYRIFVGSRTLRLQAGSRDALVSDLRPDTTYRIAIKACGTTLRCSRATRTTVRTPPLPVPVLLTGTVQVVTGNCMPTVVEPGQPAPVTSCKTSPLRHGAIRVYPATDDQPSRPVDQTTTADDGTYTLTVPATGSYCVIAEVPGATSLAVAVAPLPCRNGRRYNESTLVDVSRGHPAAADIRINLAVW